MAGVCPLPFVVGQKAEALSFKQGFRGAWFCCEIKEISRRKGHIGAVLKYLDFPDEKDAWLQLYQLRKKSREKTKQLMLRPEYPIICKKDQIPDPDAVSEVMVVADCVWKEGDLVDWWTTGCYWSGRVTEILGNDEAKIQLTAPPMGEGESYEVLLKDLRPTLEWSVKLGWTVPISKNGNESRRCARLIQPVKQATHDLPILHIQKNAPVTTVSSFDTSGSLGKTKISKSEREILHQPLSTKLSKESAKPTKAPEVIVKTSSSESSGKSKRSKSEREMLNQPLSTTRSKDSTEAPEITTQFVSRTKAIGETSCSNRNADSLNRDTSAQFTAEEDLCDSSYPLKKFKSSDGIPLNSTHTDTLEAAILDLEELADKVKWLKRILESGIPVSNAMRPPWKFIEHRGSSLPG